MPIKKCFNLELELALELNMCLLFIANNVHKDYKLILAANRDEFYNRPTLPAHFRTGSNHELLAGEDLQGGGTWLGITKTGRIAALTNYRDIKNIKSDAPTRGNLTINFLAGKDTPEEYYNKIESNAEQFNGFNLIFGFVNNLYYFSNQSFEFKKLDAGLYGLSNALLDTPWYKVEKIKQKFNELVIKDNFKLEDAFNILLDTEVSPDESLPDTGVGPELERVLSSAFIKTETYGTRCSTIILIDMENNVTFVEKTYLPDKDKFIEVNHEFTLKFES